MTKLILIALGGGLGAVLRYALSSGAQRVSERLMDGTFPIGTLTVNVIGCVGIGALGTLFAGSILVREEVRLAVIVGFLGGFTTFSAFGYETMGLIAEGEWWRAAANVMVQNVVGLAAVFGGYRIALLWQGI